MPAKQNIVIKIGAMISVIFGVLWTITIIGAIFGIPAIILNGAILNGRATNNSFDSGITRLWSKRDVKLGVIFGIFVSLIGGILVLIGEYLFS